MTLRLITIIWCFFLRYENCIHTWLCKETISSSFFFISASLCLSFKFIVSVCCKVDGWWSLLQKGQFLLFCIMLWQSPLSSSTLSFSSPICKELACWKSSCELELVEELVSKESSEWFRARLFRFVSTPFTTDDVCCAVVFI